MRGTPAACHLPARDGMVVSTEHPEAVRVRSTVLDLTLAMLTPHAERDGFGQLGIAAARHGRPEPSVAPLHRFHVDDSKSFFLLDREACILCGRCAVACGAAPQIGAFGAQGSAKATNEDGYLVQKFERVVISTSDIDHCTRLCHSPSVEAMLASMGSGATSNSYVDYEEAGCLMVVGADASSNHPVIAVRFRRAVSRGARLIVVNPKRVELCDQADLWLRQRPGTDVALFNAMARVILDEGLHDDAFVRARTEGFHAWRGALETYTLDHAERVTGVPARHIAQAAHWYAKPAFSGSCLVWGMGITQHVNGIHNAHALLNLSLVAGQ